MGTVRVLGRDPPATPPSTSGSGSSRTATGSGRSCSACELVERARGCARSPTRPRRDRALGTVALEDVADRAVGGFSKGMRQRVKLAQALAHDPELLLLDEPLNGTDPAQRRHIIELIQRARRGGPHGAGLLHVLHEVERMAPRVVVLVNGRLVAEGDTLGIRDLIADRPRTIRVDAGPATRGLAQQLIGENLIEGVRFDDGALIADTDRGRALQPPPAGAGARGGRDPAAGRAPRRRPRERLLLPHRARPHEGPVNGPIYRLTHAPAAARQAAVALSLVPLVPALLALAYAASGTATRQDAYSSLVGQLLIPSAASFVALVLGASALGDERDDGTILYLASTPLPRLSIVVAKLLAAWTATMLLCVPGAPPVHLADDGLRRVGDRLGPAGAGGLDDRLLRGVLAAGAADPPAGGRRLPLHPVLGGVDRQRRDVGRQALDRRLRAGAGGPGGTGREPLQRARRVGVFALLLLAAVTVAAAWLGGWRLGRVELP